MATKTNRFEEVARLQAQRLEIEAKIKEEQAGALAEILDLTVQHAEQIGASLDDLIDGLRARMDHGTKKEGKTGAKRPPVPAKYQNPKNHAEQWSGRGRTPLWLQSATQAGASLESLTIEAQKKKP